MKQFRVLSARVPNQKFFLSEDQQVLYRFENDRGDQLAVILNGETGNIEVAGFDADGDLVTLIPMMPCTFTNCKYPDNHTQPFALDQYKD